MTGTKTIHIALSLTLAAALATGCTDRDLLDDGRTAGNPNAITFTALACAATDLAVSRAANEEVYEPLELEANGETALYLHTYVSDRIGYRPGQDAPGQSRANQVDAATDLARFHSTFMVRADMRADGSSYIGWTNTRLKAADNNEVWVTDRTEYWPGEQVLAFHAVSPAAEFANLGEPVAGFNSLQFSYTARKGEANRDAEAQPDLLVAASECNKPASVEGRAPLRFNHALSAIKFAVRDVLGGEVVNIKIAGVHSSGTCLFEADPDTGLGTFSWTDQQGCETYSQDFNHAIADRIVDPTDDTQDILLTDRMPEKTFMMIPQPIPDNAEIIVTLRRDGMQPAEITVRGKIKANNITEWKPGHEYVYTISTSKDNWVYVLSATGNHNSATGAHNVDGNQIYVYSPSEDDHDLYGDEAYFKVTSYRYRANKPSVVEALPWRASHGDATQYRLTATGGANPVPNRDILAADWINDPLALAGQGSTSPERHDLSFAQHHQMTDWPGDIWMQDQKAYDGNSESTPWDLSTAGGKLSRSTANCYVVDREGWYCFPLVYGNAITDGNDNTDAYKFQGTVVTGLPIGEFLKNFTDYNGNDITGPDIPDNQCKRADVVWSDVYNVVSDISLTKINGTNMIKFRVNRFNMQQGSTIIALYDKESGGNIVWSWHIWFTEHWLDPVTGICNARNQESVTFEGAEGSGWRNRGDLTISNLGISGYAYHIAPYNLGWCDPKNVDYLRRPGTMAIVQYLPDGSTVSGHTASLPILQEGAHIEYKYGNNTYYQFGRKDPIVGFVDHASQVKRNFGPKQYELGSQRVSIMESIRNPQTLYCGYAAVGTDKWGDDWCSNQYVNLWNNNKQVNFKAGAGTEDGTDASLFHSLKTVYDPCPPGYMVPPASVLKLPGPDNNGKYNNSDSNNSGLKKLNGRIIDEYTFQIWTSAAKNEQESIWLTSTGNRWYTSARPELAPAGGNFNPQIVYLWSSNSIATSGSYMAYGLALGLDGNNKYCITPFFQGRRSMARPVRPIREAYTHP